MFTMKLKHTDQEFLDLIKTSTSIRDLIKNLGLIPAGGNYQTVNRRIKTLQADVSHFTGMLWSKGKKLPAKYHRLQPLKDILVKGRPTQSNRLKQRLLKEKGSRCE